MIKMCADRREVESKQGEHSVGSGKGFVVKGGKGAWPVGPLQCVCGP